MATGQSAGVRFAAENQEIAPEHSLEDIQMSNDRRRDDINPATEQELAQLKTTLQNNIQNARMQHHAFEPVSLPGSMPASRVSNLCPSVLDLQMLTFASRYHLAPIQVLQHPAGDTWPLARPKLHPGLLLRPQPYTLLL